VELQPDTPDTHLWRLPASGQYSTKSTYKALLQGATSFEPVDRVWNPWAPSKCKFFMWLVEHNRCWTSDRVTKHGMDHPECCPLCDHHDETINHLLISCMFARQVWLGLLWDVGFHELVPQPGEDSFDAWWYLDNQRVHGQHRRGFNYRDPRSLGHLEA
jgi:hypothetical protein